jgi:hypothetical protein
MARSLDFDIAINGPANANAVIWTHLPLGVVDLIVKDCLDADVLADCGQQQFQRRADCCLPLTRARQFLTTLLTEDAHGIL